MATDIRQRLVDALGSNGASTDYDLDMPDRPKRIDLRPAAVLVPITINEAGASLMLTKRSSALRHHPGQVAFPGGKQDARDPDLVSTALREANEETGLPHHACEILGELPTHETVTGFQMHPFIGIITAPFERVPEAGEVDEIFDVPLSLLLAPENYRVEGREWRGAIRHYFTVPYGPYYIWGATARILHNLATQVSR